MAKKIPKVKTRGPVKFFSPGSGLSWEEKLYMLAGGLSPFGIGRRVDATKLGRAGRFGLGSLRFLGLTNPWLMAPAALTGLAKYGVGKAFDPYRDETGRIGEAGHAQLASEARAREALMAQRNAARQNQNAGGIARLL